MGFFLSKLIRILLLGALSFLGALTLLSIRRPSETRASALAEKSWPSYIKYGGPVLAGAALLAVLGAGFFAWSGAYDVSASAGHWPITHDFLHYVMKQSVSLHAPKLKSPELDDPTLILRGAAHYHTGCAPCHGAPGTKASPIERGATPPPPALYDMARAFTPDELHWIVKHGIKMTAMPAWPTQKRDDEVWSMVAFLDRLPQLDKNEYEHLAIGPAATKIQAEQNPGIPALAEALPDVTASCSRCHGSDGRGRDRAFPNIAGLNATYILHQLQAFSDGSRPSGFMQPVASRLTDEEKQRLSTYFAELPRGGNETPEASNADLAAGKRIATFGVGGRVPACFSCHALRASDRSPGIPQLTEQPSDYLANQLLLFGSGVRAQTPNDKIMARLARQLSYSQIEAVSAYFATLAPKDQNAATAAANAR